MIFFLTIMLKLYSSDRVVGRTFHLYHFPIAKFLVLYFLAFF